MGPHKPNWLRGWHSLLLGAILIFFAGTSISSHAWNQLLGSEEERAWSRKFLEAKTRVRERREECDNLF